MLTDSVNFMDESPVHRRITRRGDDLFISTSQTGFNRLASLDDIIVRIDSCIAEIDRSRTTPKKAAPIDLKKSVEDVLRLIDQVTQRSPVIALV